jgi:transcriptional regulator with XRE-family HTH domain
MDKVLNNLRLSIHSCLAQQKMNQTRLASALGVGKAAVSKIMKSDTLPNLSTIRDISAALSVEPFYLLMSPEERAVWDAKTAKPTLADQLVGLAKTMPPEGLVAAVQALKLVASATASRAQAQAEAQRKKAQGE